MTRTHHTATHVFLAAHDALTRALTAIQPNQPQRPSEQQTRAVQQQQRSAIQWIRITIDDAPIAARSAVEQAVNQSINTQPPLALPTTDPLSIAECTRWHRTKTLAGTRISCDVVINATTAETQCLIKQLQSLAGTHKFRHTVTPT